jgi:hypothetical protein
MKVKEFAAFGFEGESENVLAWEFWERGAKGETVWGFRVVRFDARLPGVMAVAGVWAAAVRVQAEARRLVARS